MRKNSKMTDEQKLKISQSKKGSIPWNKNRKGVMIAWNKGTRKLYICNNCYQQYQILPHSGGRLFCSRKCRAEKQQMGSNNISWKGGITSITRIERSRFIYQLRDKILVRDNHTCQICNAYGVELHIDHIVPWHQDESLRFNPDNLRAICIPCHYYITFKRKIPIGSKWGISRKRSTI